MKLRVVVVDDHEVVVRCLKLVMQAQPDLEVVGEAADAAEALACVTRTRPDLVILDMELPGSNGIIVTRQILQQLPNTMIIIFSAYVTPEYVQEAIQEGVTGYLHKGHKMAELEEGLQAARRGLLYLCPEAAAMLARDYRKKSSLITTRLTTREREILKYVAEGQSTKEIAGGLNVSIKTVEPHRQNIMAKLDLYSIAGLTKYAIRQGLTRI